MKNILLTGASGTVGFEALKQLHAKKDRYNITIFDVKTPKAEKAFKPYADEISIVYGDIRKEEDIAKIAKNQDAVIHLAAIIPPLADDQPELSYQVNAIGTKNLIDALQKYSPNAFFMYSSSISVYGDRLNTPWITVNDPLLPSNRDEYAKTKLAAEDFVQKSTLDWTIFRLAAIMGGHKISKLMFHQPLNTSLEIATPRDTARAFVNGIEKQDELSKRIFNLGGGETCRIQYDEFLEKSFEMNGLGKLNFPPNTFAEKNFHCGYYKDADELNNIVNFRKDTLETYFDYERSKISPIRKFLTSLLKGPIKYYLKTKSEPLAAIRKNDKKEIDHYFDNN